MHVFFIYKVVLFLNLFVLFDVHFLIKKTHFCIFAGCHNDVVKIVELACKHNVCLIPYGGELSAHWASKQSKLLHTVHQAVVYLDVLPEIMRFYN